MAILQKSSRKSREEATVQLETAIHRRILNFLKEAVHPEDLVYEKLPTPDPEMGHTHEGNHHPEGMNLERRKILDPEIAKEIFDFRDLEFPLGFRNVKEVPELEGFNHRPLDHLLDHFGNQSYGSWSVFPQDIPRRGPGGYDGVVHAALLHPDGGIPHSLAQQGYYMMFAINKNGVPSVAKWIYLR